MLLGLCGLLCRVAYLGFVICWFFRVRVISNMWVGLNDVFLMWWA